MNVTPNNICPLCGSSKTEILGIEDMGKEVYYCQACGGRYGVDKNQGASVTDDTNQPLHDTDADVGTNQEKLGE